MKDKVHQVLMIIDDLKISTKEYCQDKEIPLENRWEIFSMCGHLVGNQKNYIEDFDSLPEEFIMYGGDFYDPEKYQNITVKDIITYIEEYINDENHIHTIDLDEFKEDVLDKFIWSFVYDW